MKTVTNVVSFLCISLLTACASNMNNSNPGKAHQQQHRVVTSQTSTTRAPATVTTNAPVADYTAPANNVPSNNAMETASKMISY